MIYVTGDMHGDITRFDMPEMKSLKKGDTLIVCGDFGFLWDGSKDEEKRLKKLSKKKYDICFIDGTHENFEMLNALPVENRYGGKIHRIRDNIIHLMRGQVFTIEGLTFFTMGGGESPDIDIRFEENAWSKNEFPDRKELIEGAENIERYGCKVDYVITHEPPIKIKSFLKLKDGESVHINGLNTYLEEMSETCQFKHWYFGSMHLDKHISSSMTAVYGNVFNVLTGERVY